MKLQPRLQRLALAALTMLGASLAVQAQTSPSTPDTGTSSGTTPGSSSGMGTTDTATGTGAGTTSGTTSGSSDSATGSGSGTTGASGSTGSGMGYGGSTGMGSSQSAGTSAYGSSPDAYSILPFTRRGYVGLNIGRPELNVGCGTGGYACDDPDVSGYFYTGGLVNDWLGAEVGYFNSGKADRAGGRTRSQGLNLSAVFRAPLGQFNVFGKVGAMYGETRVSTGPLSNVTSGTERGWGPVYGAGVGFDFTPSSGVVLEWQRHEFRYPGGGGREDVDNTSIGYVYRF